MRVTPVTMGAAALTLALAAALAACTPTPEGGSDPSGASVNGGSPAGSPGFGGPSGGASGGTATSTATGGGSHHGSTSRPSHSGGHASPTRTPGGSTGGNALHVHLSTDRGNHGARSVSLTALTSGRVDAPLSDGSNKPLRLPATANVNVTRGVSYTWGDGESGGSDAGEVHCGAPHVKHKVVNSETDEHTYKKAGTYTIRYEVRACGIAGGQAVGTTTVTVH